MIYLPFEIREAFPWLYLNEGVENIVAWNFWILIFQSLIILILFLWIRQMKNKMFPNRIEIEPWEIERNKKKAKKRVKKNHVQSPKQVKSKPKPKQKRTPKKEKESEKKMKKDDPFRKFKNLEEE